MYKYYGMYLRKNQLTSWAYAQLLIFGEIRIHKNVEPINECFMLEKKNALVWPADLHFSGQIALFKADLQPNAIG
jgi:hypothetical protein